ncbi:MAG: hypothetical protein RL383_889 [Actinomycetota bacterium]|jgi:hypothetical protein
MTLVYRAVWTDNEIDIHTAVLECFAAWLDGRNTPIDIPVNRVEQRDGRTLTTVKVNNAAVVGVQAQLVEDYESERGRWTTTVTGMRIGEDNVVWVTVHADVDKGIWQRSIRAPRVVRELLLAGGSPTIDDDALEVQPREIDDEKSVTRLTRSISSTKRRIPLLVIAARNNSDLTKAVQRATRAAETLAGVARVVVVEPGMVSALNAELPDGLHVPKGWSRLFMPDCANDAINPRLTISFNSNELGSDPRELGLLVSKHIGHSILWPTVPPEWADGKRRIDEARRKLKKKNQPAEVEIEAVADYTDDPEEAWRLYAEDLQWQLADANELAAEWHKRAEEYYGKLISLLTKESAPNPYDKLTFAATIEEVQRLSQWIQIPRTAPQGMVELDTHVSARVWAKDFGRLCASFESYARYKSTHTFKGNYLTWCKQNGDYSADKIALNEGKTTKQIKKLMEARTFTVDTQVNQSGKIAMLNHAKIQARGSGFIPRVYFHDDTGGATGKIHIGFIGPHYLVPHANWD